VFEIDFTEVRERYITRTADDVNKACTGDQRAFERLILKLENKLYRVARTVLLQDADCADAIQETLLRAWKRIPQLQDQALFEPWLMRILIRECYRLLKRNRRYEKYIYHEREVAADPEVSLDMRRILDTLPTHERVVLLLHYALDYGVKEISVMLRIPVGTVKSRLARARSHLSQKWKEDIL